MKRKGVLRLTAVVLAIVSCAFLPAHAQEAGEKEEVVMARLSSDGTVTEVSVLNLVTAENGRAVDYGEYASLTNLTAADALSAADGRLEYATDKEKLCYTGVMKGTALPWKIRLTFKIDGQTLTPQEAAGRSGQLELGLSVTENEECGGNFFQTFLLQIKLRMDRDKCRGITCEDALISDSVSDRVLTILVMPGAGLETTVKAAVKDFSLDPVEFTAAPIEFSLGSVWDEDGLLAMIDGFAVGELLPKEKREELTGALTSLSDGAAKLAAGTKKLREAGGELTDGMKELSDGTAALKKGAAEVADGAGKIAGYAEKIDVARLRELCAGAENFLTKDELERALAELEPGSLAYTVLSELAARLDALSDTATGTIDKLEEAQTGAKALADGTKKLSDGLNELDKALKDVQPQVKAYVQGVADVDDGAKALAGGTKEIRTGIETVTAELTEAEKTIAEKLDEARARVRETSGRMEELTDLQSFVSEKNERVTSVAFSFKTDAIEFEAPAQPEPEPVLTWWQKILRFFGLR